MSSPYELDAHYSRNRPTAWVGDKVHLRASCDDDLPQLITTVEPTTADVAITSRIHAALAQRDLLPSVHLVDSGCIDTDLLVERETQDGLDLLGPMRRDSNWQARAERGFASPQLHSDWERQQAICAAGRTSHQWTPAMEQLPNKEQHATVAIRFDQRECQPCIDRAHWTKTKNRGLSVPLQAQYDARRAALARQETPEFKQAYAKRAGVEGTMALGVRTSGVRRARYVGQPQPHLQQLATAAGINLLRVSAWLDERPRAKTRHSSFERV